MTTERIEFKEVEMGTLGYLSMLVLGMPRERRRAVIQGIWEAYADYGEIRAVDSLGSSFPPSFAAYLRQRVEKHEI